MEWLSNYMIMIFEFLVWFRMQSLNWFLENCAGIRILNFKWWYPLELSIEILIHSLRAFERKRTDEPAIGTEWQRCGTLFGSLGGFCKPDSTLNIRLCSHVRLVLIPTFFAGNLGSRKPNVWFWNIQCSSSKNMAVLTTYLWHWQMVLIKKTCMQGGITHYWSGTALFL